jgi:hypothetical protein
MHIIVVISSISHRAGCAVRWGNRKKCMFLLAALILNNKMRSLDRVEKNTHFYSPASWRQWQRSASAWWHINSPLRKQKHEKWRVWFVLHCNFPSHSADEPHKLNLSAEQLVKNKNFPFPFVLSRGETSGDLIVEIGEVFTPSCVSLPSCVFMILKIY